MGRTGDSAEVRCPPAHRVPYSLLVDVFTRHLCDVATITVEPPDYVLSCEDCVLRVRSSDKAELERLAQSHRASTRQPLSV